MNEIKKETVGKQYLDYVKGNREELSVAEHMETVPEYYWKQVMPWYEAGKKHYPGDFYIEVNVKRERLMPDLRPRVLPITRYSCPTPNHDQDLYFYNRANDTLNLVWSIPSVDACIYLKNNAKYLKEDEIKAYGIVIDFESGKHFNLMKKLNHEAPDSPLLIN